VSSRWQQAYCIAMTNHYITTQSSAPLYRVFVILLLCDLQNSCLHLSFNLTLKTQTQNQNSYLHFSYSLLLKFILFINVMSLQHILSAYESTCIFILLSYIDSLIAAYTHFCYCHYVSYLTAVNWFTLLLQISQQRLIMSCRYCLGCTSSQCMQLSVSYLLIKILLNFLTSLSFMCFLYTSVYLLYFYLLTSLSS